MVALHIASADTSTRRGDSHRQPSVAAAKSAAAQIVSLGKRILRCETAGLVAITLIGYERGELGA